MRSRRESRVKRRGLSRGAWWLCLLALPLGCSQGPRLKGQIAGLEEIAKQAERNGAVRCAPRELAMAQSHLKFAQIELEQGYLSKAQRHLWLAEPNAHAANFLSPPEYCTDRGMVEVAVPKPQPKPGDRDGDGYLDTEDACPDEPENFNGYQDTDGCPDDPDTDGDGIPDSRDQCVLQPEDKDGYLDEDGCPDLDNDLDGIPDSEDKCPNDPEDPDGYEDQDGCPDLDNDGDGVPDLKDQCPNTIGSTTEEPLGCPSKPALVVVTDCEVKITQQIHFEYNKATIRKESHPVLDAVVDVLQKNSAIKLEIQGHTDNQGSKAYNQKLSGQRAESVLKYLVSRGIDPNRLTSNGYGFDRPLVPNTSERNRALNRRVQFVRTEGAKEGCPK
ncbi:MAG: OmpA family protein [Polyangiaceae bacterium]|nr:OmpA family protein [Polyangiaceae bacterium]MCW5791704.1 OmpA family protein [Polyangiaceae bacterium]